MFMRAKFLPAAALCVAALQAPSASAAVIAYTSESDFLAAVSTPITLGFEGIAPPGGILFTTPTVAGVTFTATEAGIVIDGAATPDYGASFFSAQGNHDNVPPNALAISFAGYKAFGFSYGSYISSAESYSATLSTGDIFNFATSVTPGTAQFLGFVSDVPLTGIDLVSTIGPNGDDSTGYGYAFDIPRFILADPIATPEPASWAMMIAGFAMVGRGLRRRTRLQPIAA